MSTNSIGKPIGTENLSVLVVSLLKGVIYQEADAELWNSLLSLQARVRDFVGVLALDLILDEAEGYAFLQSRQDENDGVDRKVPRLIARRPLSFPVSLLLALLRKKMAEFDAIGGDTRLVVSRTELVELIRLFLPETTNESKLVDQIDTYINKIVELGFLRRLKVSAGSDSQDSTFEVRRILKAFVDAQWLSEFNDRLAGYQKEIAGLSGGSGDE
jgi:hypothetical protein